MMDFFFENTFYRATRLSMFPTSIKKLHELIPLHILLPAVLLSIYLLKSLCKKVSHSHRAWQRGCLPAPLEPSKLPFGIDTLLASLRADHDQRTPDHVAKRFAAMGVHTFRMSVLGTTNLVTAEPRNIQAILATQFNDFGMGVTRSTNLKIVLGRSIFAADAQEEGSSRALYDFLDVLLERCSNDEEVREQVLGLLAAGRDTTASLMSWTWYCLLRNPHVFTKLRSKILSTFGQGPNSPSSVITFASLKECTYLQHVLFETLRLHSVVPFNSRRALRDTTLPTGGGPDGKSPIFVPKGTEVNFSTHVLHRRKDLWGEEDADDFVPERWEKKRGAASAAWHFVPFNGGPRICIGQQLALTEAGYVLVRMLQRYDAVEGLDIDPTRDWHNFTVVCSPGSPVDRNQAVLCRLRRA
ncbi:unnamed protein product [Fusarium graminearum]|nr:unnamed protein product [Fusarium graminearum]